MKLLFHLLVTRRQRRLLSRLPLVPTWRYSEYFWDNIASPWQRFIAALVIILSVPLVITLFTLISYIALLSIVQYGNSLHITP